VSFVQEIPGTIGITTNYEDILKIHKEEGPKGQYTCEIN
jgi:hypothetical protein